MMWPPTGGGDAQSLTLLVMIVVSLMALDLCIVLRASLRQRSDRKARDPE